MIKGRYELKNKIGVMQGRLLPKFQGRYQAHPVGYWQDEFAIAQQIGLDCIEFILDYNDADQNPLLREGGVEEIKALTEKTGVDVFTVCADYFMEAPLHSEDQNISIHSQQVLIRLLKVAADLNVQDVVIPCVDKSSLDTLVATDRFVKQLTPVLRIAEKLNINLSLETDLAPRPFIELLNRFNSERVTVNYDIGNSAALGYDPVEELNYYGDRITDIHIKDRLLNGGSVILGNGDAKFEILFHTLKGLDYKGPFIMQAYRDEEGITGFEEQLKWVIGAMRKTLWV
jgi:L-ribulose-5-phosphate 3-epimerase